MTTFSDPVSSQTYRNRLTFSGLMSSSKIILNGLVSSFAYSNRNRIILTV